MDLREPLATETVANAGYRQPVTVKVDARIKDVITTMREHRVGCAVVVDGEKPVGIFTERDLVKRVYAKGVSLDTPVSELMTADPVVTHTEAPLYVAGDFGVYFLHSDTVHPDETGHSLIAEALVPSVLEVERRGR